MNEITAIKQWNFWLISDKTIKLKSFFFFSSHVFDFHLIQKLKSNRKTKRLSFFMLGTRRLLRKVFSWWKYIIFCILLIQTFLLSMKWTETIQCYRRFTNWFGNPGPDVFNCYFRKKRARVNTQITQLRKLTTVKIFTDLYLIYSTAKHPNNERTIVEFKMKVNRILKSINHWTDSYWDYDCVHFNVSDWIQSN